jgi:hypothetical protein
MTGQAVYLVPRSQVWPGSRSRATGHVHLRATADAADGRLKVKAGQLLCKRPPGWYERSPDGDEPRCPECTGRAERLRIGWDR